MQRTAMPCIRLNIIKSVRYKQIIPTYSAAYLSFGDGRKPPRQKSFFFEVVTMKSFR